MSSDKKLGMIYKGKTIWLSYLRNPSQLLLPETIASKYGKGGVFFVRDVLGIKVKPLEIPPIQLNSIQFNLYFHIKNTQTSRSSKITKKQNMEEKTGRPMRPDYCPSLKKK